MDSKDKAKQLLRSLAAQVVHHSGLTHVLSKQEDFPWRILMYHRVVRPEDCLYPLQPGMYVSPQSFAMQMGVLAQQAKVVPLDQLTEAIAEDREIPPKTVAITFDDGWTDVYQHAFPILKDRKLPATVFLPTSFIGTSEWFWTDKVALAVTALRKEKQYTQSARTRIEECGDIENEQYARITELLSIGNETSLPNALDTYINELKGIDYKQRVCIVNTLLTLAKEFTSVKLERAFLNWNEIREMAEDQITFGSHSHLHHNFPELSQAQMSDEIENSFQLLRAKELTPSSVFCYPMGQYTSASQDALVEKNICFAASTHTGSNLDSKPMLLGRVGIHDDISRTAALFTSRVWVQNVF